MCFKQIRFIGNLILRLFPSGKNPDQTNIIFFFNKKPNPTHFPYNQKHHFEAPVGVGPMWCFYTSLILHKITVKRSLFFFIVAVYILVFTISLEYSCLATANVSLLDNLFRISS